MATRKLRFIIVMLGSLTALLMLVPQLGINLAQAGPIEGDGVLDNWPYKYAISKDDDGSYIVTHDYARASMANVRAAASAMNKTADQLARDRTSFKVTLVFVKPLPIEEFRAFARGLGLAPTQNIVRGIDANGKPVTIGVPAIWARDKQGRLLIGQPVPGGEPFDTTALARMTEGHNPIRVVGVISTDVILDSATHAKVRDDSRVYAVDIMEQVLTDLVQQRYPGVPTNKIKAWSSLLYPAMERTGIAPKATP